MKWSSVGARLSNSTSQLTGSTKHVAALCCYRTEITVSSETEAFLQVILRHPITTDTVKSGVFVLPYICDCLIHLSWKQKFK